MTLSTGFQDFGYSIRRGQLTSKFPTKRVYIPNVNKQKSFCPGQITSLFFITKSGPRRTACRDSLPSKRKAKRRKAGVEAWHPQACRAIDDGRSTAGLCAGQGNRRLASADFFAFWGLACGRIASKTTAGLAFHAAACCPGSTESLIPTAFSTAGMVFSAGLPLVESALHSASLLLPASAAAAPTGRRMPRRR